MRVLLACVALLLPQLAALAEPAPFSLPAFPGAEGFGSTTPGGRGGRVIAVTNLHPDGPGSLREALSAREPRLVVFRVGGTIQLMKDLEITSPFVTVLGQTAPANGICLRGAGLRIATHDVVIRHLRVRPGDAKQGPRPENRDGIGIGNEQVAIHDIVLDHCSVSWAIDENVQLWYPCHDITIQWCLIAESLERSLHPKGRHGMGLLVGDHAKRISVHHNLFAHNMDRNPLLKGDTETEVVNNLVYNWRNFATGCTDPEGSGLHRADVIANLYLPGPQTNNRFGVGIDRNVKPGSLLYLRGNLDPARERDAGDEWAVTASRAEHDVRAKDRLLPGDRITTSPAAELPHLVLSAVGATLPKRDALDQRIVTSVEERGGQIINSPGECPDYQGGPAPTDTDTDGLPDDWEQRHGLDREDAADAAKLSPKGYAWIEVFANELTVRVDTTP